MDLEKEFEKLNLIEEDNKNYYVLSIDIGVLNLGLSVTRIDSEFNILEVVWIDLINITEFKHNAIDKYECQLHHTRTFSDWLDHVYQDNQQFFDMADYILIEKQPPMGFVVIEQLIFNKFRSKANLINPINVHTYLNMGGLDYEQRKIKSQQIALKLLTDPDLCQQITFYHRQHDICDSLCILLYWLHKKTEELDKQRRIERFKALKIDGGDSLEQWLNKHKYSPAIPH